MTQAGYARPELLLETDWLEQHLDDPDIRIVDCDPFDVYRRAHIKGAVGIRVHHYIKQPEYPTDNRKYPLVAPPDTAKEVMESLGIGARHAGWWPTTVTAPCGPPACGGC